MTGFARGEHSDPLGTLSWELRSVNHRYLELGLRLPDEFRALEAEVRQTIATVVRRGKLDANLQFRGRAAASPTLDLNEAYLDELLARAHEVTRRATARGGTLDSPTALELLRWPGVLQEQERDREPLHAAALAALASALTALAASRSSEGARIQVMIESRCAQLEALIQAVRGRLPEVQARIRARLESRLAQLTLPAEPNPERLEQEILLALARMDVDEELDRLTSHIAEVKKALAGDEAAGRRLDFLMQEFNREANTLSSKSQDAETSRAAVDMKVLIEQIREQVQNVE